MSKAFPIHVEQTPEGDYLLSWTEELVLCVCSAAS